MAVHGVHVADPQLLLQVGNGIGMIRISATLAWQPTSDLLSHDMRVLCDPASMFSFLLLSCTALDCLRNRNRTNCHGCVGKASVKPRH